jgi:hypothetical protein
VIQSGTLDYTPIHDNGIRGDNQIIAIADTGLSVDADNQPTHDMFIDPNNNVGSAHRKILSYYVPPGVQASLGDFSGHGSHVAGIAAGDAGTWGEYDNAPGSTGFHDGHAFSARIEMQDIEDNTGGVSVPASYDSLFGPAYENGARIHSNSWGHLIWDIYTIESAMVDNFMWRHKDFQVLFAAGNEGPAARSVRAEGDAKNAITVGATLNGENAEQVANWPNSWNWRTWNWGAGSSRGPASDNRIKPTLVAPGDGAAAETGIWSADNSEIIMDTGRCMVLVWQHLRLLARLR